MLRGRSCYSDGVVDIHGGESALVGCGTAEAARPLRTRRRSGAGALNSGAVARLATGRRGFFF